MNIKENELPNYNNSSTREVAAQTFGLLVEQENITGSEYIVIEQIEEINLDLDITDNNYRKINSHPLGDIEEQILTQDNYNKCDRICCLNNILICLLFAIFIALIVISVIADFIL